MLSNKRINLIAAALTALALIFVVAAMINPPSSEKRLGETVYENGQTINFTNTDYYSDYSLSVYENILLDGTSAASSSTGVAISDGDITINSGGIYEISGTLTDGSITVDAQDGAVVRLILNGADITSSDSPAIYINSSAKTVISLASGTENSLTDGALRTDTAADAAIYSKDDLVFNGTGSLRVNASYADGIKTNDSLKIIEGAISVVAADEAIAANDYIVMCDGSLKLKCSGAGLKCENNDDSSLGFIVFEGGSADITAEADAIHAGNDIYVNDISLTASTSDDAIHAVGTLFLNGGTANITKCYEGFEGAYIVMNGGDWSIIASDDAINATGEDSSSLSGMPPGGMNNQNSLSSEVYATINNGTLHATVSGDGLDSNSAAVINGGYIEVYGPENDGNSTLDFDGGFVINGGTVIAAGSSGMAESPTTESAQNTIIATLSRTYDAGTEISLRDSSGNIIVTAKSTKKFDWLCVSSPDIRTGSSYTITADGTEEASVTVSDSVTSAGNASSQAGGFPGNAFGGGMHNRTPSETQPDTDMQNSAPPEMPSDAMPPEMPSDTMSPEMSSDAMPPEMQNGEMPRGERGGRGGMMPGGNMQEAFGEQSTVTNPISDFLEKYFTHISCVILLAFGFAFAILFKKHIH